MLKKCTKCQIEKDLSEFRNDKYGKHGKTQRCKECLSTYKQEECRCNYCREWFVKKQSNYKFCSPQCHDDYWRRNFKLSMKGVVYYTVYNRAYKKSNKDNCLDCGKIITNDSMRCKRCHCISMSKKASMLAI